MSKCYEFDPTTGLILGSRPSNMFYIQKLSGGNPIWLPNPEKDSAQGLISTLVDSARSTSGQVIAQKICRDQDKIELSWSLLTVEEWETLLEFWDTNFEFYINYYSPVRHKKIQRIFYIGDRSYKYFDIQSNGLPTAYIECSANVIDTGVSS